MKNQCYMCQQNFETKEKLFDHLDFHARLKTQEPKAQEFTVQKLTAQELTVQEPMIQEPKTQEPTIKKKGNPAVCTDCGAETIVPFKPKEGRPVYCKKCLMLHSTKKLSENLLGNN